MLYKGKKYLSLVCKLHCSRFCSFVQCIKLICKLTSINWSNFCKLNIWGNIAAVENCQIARPDSLWKFGALKGVCLWNYLVCWARKFNHISVVENALLIQNWLSYKLKYSSLLLFILFLFNTIVFTLGNTIDYYLINTRWKHS